MSAPEHETLGPSAPDPDGALLERLRASPEGDLRAFEELVRRYQGRVVANCRYITREPNQAEDLAQEVLLKVYFGLRRFESKSSFRHWLQRIKVNHCLNHLQKEKGRQPVDIEEPEVRESERMQVAPIAHQRLEAMSERQAVAAVLNSMTETLRVPLVLCDMDELSYEEIAVMLGIGLSATKMRIKRARDEFRSRYQLRAGRQATG